MNLNLLRDQSWQDISEIWLAYHKARDYTLSAVIPQARFDKFYHQSIKYPMVLLFNNFDNLNNLQYTYNIFLVYTAIAT